MKSIFYRCELRGLWKNIHKKLFFKVSVRHAALNWRVTLDMLSAAIPLCNTKWAEDNCSERASMAPAFLPYQQSCRMLETQLSYVRRKPQIFGMDSTGITGAVQHLCTAQKLFLCQKSHNWAKHFRCCSNLLSSWGGTGKHFSERGE